MKRFALALAAGLACACSPGPAAAGAPWPSQPIKWIVPYPPGGSTDMLARLVSHKLGERLGQPVIVENKAGAGGNVGTDYAVKQPADGYTIVMGNIGPISINPALYPDLPYQPQRDLAPVTLLMSVPNLLVVNPALPARTVRELIAYAKQSPQPLDYATPGTGTLNCPGNRGGCLVKVQRSSAQSQSWYGDSVLQPAQEEYTRWTRA
ncbi:tripartite tricarboxylate transporter substrate-binding protein, partial [Achromobacter sp. Marseille-Q4962]|uniref:Bug family tripartite tricarboxylate transporter substrate binding protein n=1 Tax=Achromobacter sp. Marseille-Q4962 TaxID=2942202 RepID=UPI002073E4B3